SQDGYDAAASNGSFSTATNISSLIDSTSYTALVEDLDISTTSDVDYYAVTAPPGTGKSLTVQVQSVGFSLLAAAPSVYNGSQTLLATVSGKGQYGTTLSVTINNVTGGQQFYVKVTGADTSVFGTGTYALSLNFGSGATPTASSPNTETAKGATP